MPLSFVWKGKLKIIADGSVETEGGDSVEVVMGLPGLHLPEWEEYGQKTPEASLI